jgi:hypothetical protein
MGPYCDGIDTRVGPHHESKTNAMFAAVLEAVVTLGPIIFLMLIPVLIPIVTLSIGTLADRLTADA